MRRGWWFDAALVALFAALTAAVAAGWTHGLDLAVRDWADSHRPTPAYVIARGLNLLGQGSPLAVIALGLAVLLAWRAHSVRPVLPVLAAYAALMLTVGPVKVLTDRAAPHKPEGTPHREDLFSGGMSYPSGHTANTVVWYGVLVLLLAALLPAAARLGERSGARLALRLAPPAIVAVVTTYLGFHWITDTVAGLIAGVLLDRLLRRVNWDAVPLHRVPGGRRLAARGWLGSVPDLALR
jgi:membrane-associated phospholipid phosphatase